MDEIEQAQRLPETPQKTQIDPLPEKLKNSLYVHSTFRENITAYTLLLSHIPKDYGIIRPDGTGKELTYITIKPSYYPVSPLLPVDQVPETSKIYFSNCRKKTLLKLTYNENQQLTNIYFSNAIQCSSLQIFSQEKKLVLNLIHKVNVQDQEIGNFQLKKLRDEINAQSLLNNPQFYNACIKKEDKIIFSPIVSMTLLNNNIYLLKMENKDIALISKTQLIAAKKYIATQKKVKFTADTFFHTSHKRVSKRKAEDDTNADPAKKAKFENILKDSPTKSHGSAGQDPQQQNADTTTSYSNS